MGVVPMPADFGPVENRSYTISSFRLQNGPLLRAVQNRHAVCAVDRSRIMRDLAAGGVNAFYFEIDCELGHSASGPEYARWSPAFAPIPEAADE
jgi:hypothetical protein